LKQFAEAWKGRPLAAIGRADIHRVLDHIVARGAPISANRVLAQFAGARIDVHALSAQLQDEGAKSFVNSWNDLMGVIGSKCDVLKRAG
jgi:hypothetical protein